MLLLVTMPPREITAISVVPPPMSTIILPSGASTSRPIPRLLPSARKSYKRRGRRHARSSRGLHGFNLGAARRDTHHDAQRRREPMVLRAYHLDKSADHQLGGVEVGDNAVAQRADGADAGCSFPCIILAFSPTATSLPLESRATYEGSSTTILSLWMMIVFAVPRSTAISCVSENIPILLLLLSVVLMLEVTDACHNHGDAVLVAEVNGLVVAD